MGRDISNEGFLLWHGAKLREKLTFFMRWQENVLDGQAMDWFPCLPTRKKYLFMGFSKSTLFFISKILYLSYCKIDNQTSELCNFTQVKSLFFIMAYQFSGKKMGGRKLFWNVYYYDWKFYLEDDMGWSKVSIGGNLLRCTVVLVMFLILDYSP